ncbi:DNA mismatch repair protein MutS [Treponema sp. OMZ 840]|uniref:DNA mismatch repair protein MutS n=1 Tax=Treponema sp. OMZ 840 TaxID=244313 RepID=UPI003D94FE64
MEKMPSGTVTPLMAQYRRIKAQYSTEVLFFRLGDFYEMFDGDAVEVSRLLNLTLTRRGESPMCGIPYHASRVYIARLLRLGKKIAICEQISLPENGKGLAERKVVEVITPGTALEEEYLEQNTNNFLAALCFAEDTESSIYYGNHKRTLKKQTVSFAYIDISTGTFCATHWNCADTEEELPKELGRVMPRELLVSRSFAETEKNAAVFNRFPSVYINIEDDWRFDAESAYKQLLRQFGTLNLQSFALTAASPEIFAAGSLLRYVLRTSAFCRSDGVLPQVTGISVYADTDYVVLDHSSRKNLEITENLRDGTMRYSLLETVQHTQTAMGTRLLRSFFAHPLCVVQDIKRRQNHVGLFVKDGQTLRSVRTVLSRILDIERLTSRIALEKAHAKDLQALRTGLENWLTIRNLCEKFAPGEFSDALYVFETDTALKIIDIIRSSLLDEPSVSLNEGGIIKDGWSQELDRYRRLQTDFTRILDDYLEEEKQRTGIPNLKIRFNRNIGYYIEVTKGKLDAVPEHFILRRALVNGDRYTSVRLQELERELTGAGEKIIEIEKALFLEIRAKLAEHIRYLLTVASEIAYIDVIASFAYAAGLHNWTCPDIEEGNVFEITGGRHPVVEMHLPSGEFVPNDAFLCGQNFALVTGPNMAGKSTYLRQNALIVFLAQTGSWVPAEKARIGTVDRIFCRVGASDNLARGESTFLVEMSETALILRAATERSLVIMDEVGRGTSTEDGLSIAWAVCEYLLNTLQARTFFATHYHELTRILHKKLQLLCLDVQERSGEIVFTKKIRSGASENSYGLHVARLAGIPHTIIERAQVILDGLQKKTTWTESSLPVFPPSEPPVCDTDKNPQHAQNAQKESRVQTFQNPGLFSDEELILDEILSSEPDAMTPLEALQLIARWKKNLSGKT